MSASLPASTSCAYNGNTSNTRITPSRDSPSGIINKSDADTGCTDVFVCVDTSATPSTQRPLTYSPPDFLYTVIVSFRISNGSISIPHNFICYTVDEGGCVYQSCPVLFRYVLSSYRELHFTRLNVILIFLSHLFTNLIKKLCTSVLL